MRAALTPHRAFSRARGQSVLERSRVLIDQRVGAGGRYGVAADRRRDRASNESPAACACSRIFGGDWPLQSPIGNLLWTGGGSTTPHPEWPAGLVPAAAASMVTEAIPAR